MEPFVYGTSNDGNYQIVSLTKEKLDAALDVIRKSFFIDENVCIGVELSKYPKAMKELEELSVRAAEDGCSIIAIEKSTGVVAAVAFNKIQVPAVKNEENYFENFEKRISEPASKSLVRFMIEAYSECDIFKLANVDCLLEIMFTATLKEHRGKGLCRKLCEASIDLCRNLSSGNDKKVFLVDKPRNPGPRPKIVTAIFTSFITQKIGKRLNFREASVLSYDRWTFNGKTYAQRIGPETPNAVVVYFEL